MKAALSLVLRSEKSASHHCFNFSVFNIQLLSLSLGMHFIYCRENVKCNTGIVKCLLFLALTRWTVLL